MAAVGKTLRSLLGEALGIIADHDFPDQWPTMCQELVSKINTSDMAVTNGILEASSAAFKKFDGAFDNGAQRCRPWPLHTHALFALADSMRYPLAAALADFQEPLVQLLELLTQEIGAAHQDKAALMPRFTVSTPAPSSFAYSHTLSLGRRYRMLRASSTA